MSQLTHDRSICVSPSWGPKGQTVIYTSFRTAFPYVYSIDMSSRPHNRKRLTDYPGLNLSAAISPNGSHMALALSKDGNPDLYTLRLRDRKTTRITRTQNAAEASPSWSPDGRRVAYVSDSSGRPHIYIIKSDGSAPKRLTFRGNENVGPDWGKNGLIAFSSKRGRNYQIFTINPATGEEKAVTSDAADYEDPSWAPDGRHIVCTRTQAYVSTVYILDTLGDRPIRLIHEKGDWHSPAWSP
jgi:TolB protein